MLNIGSGVSGGSGLAVIVNGGTVNYTGTSTMVAKLQLRGGVVFNSSGAASFTGGSYTGVGDGGSATLNVTAGTFNTTQTLFMGAAGADSGVVNVSGGTLTTTSNVNVGTGYQATANTVGTITISGTGLLTTGVATGSFRLGNLGSGSGTLNLNGGTFATNTAVGPGAYAITEVGKTQASVVNFNGGTLRANGTALALTGVTANVRDSGARIDTNGFDVTVAAPLVHSGIGGDSPVDDGLRKLGAGALTLPVGSTSTYSGPTFVDGGTLVVNGSISASVGTAVKNATLAGGGSLANAVNIGDGSGASSSARIAPGTATTVGTLTTGALSLASDAAYTLNIDSAAGTADTLIAPSVSLSSGAMFTFSDIGSGTLTPGLSFTVIDNTGAAPIAGTFANLANNSTFAFGTNTFHASYTGGTGNDLTLTVVPEPSAFLALLSGMGMLVGLRRHRRAL